MQSVAPSEAEYLQNQANAARAALGRAVGETGHALVRCADIRIWTRQYPLPATISACVLSFLVSNMVARHPKGSKHERKRLAKALRANRAARLKGASLAPNKTSAMFRLLRRWVSHSVGVWMLGLVSPKVQESEDTPRLTPREKLGKTEHQGDSDELAKGQMFEPRKHSRFSFEP